MKKQIPIWPVIGVAILIVAAVAYMVVIRPKRAESGRLDEQIAEMQMKVSAAQLASRPQQQATTIKVADVFEVSKAMPDTDDMPGIILDLNSVAEADRDQVPLDPAERADAQDGLQRDRRSPSPSRATTSTSPISSSVSATSSRCATDACPRRAGSSPSTR